MTTLIAVFLILFFLVCIVAVIRSSYMPWYDGYEDEVVTTHTTTTTTTTAAGGTNNYTGLNVNGFPVVGMITRKYLEGTPYVIDPVDGDRVFLNTSDDIYEDGEGKWWGLQ